MIDPRVLELQRLYWKEREELEKLQRFRKEREGTLTIRAVGVRMHDNPMPGRVYATPEQREAAREALKKRGIIV